MANHWSLVLDTAPNYPPPSGVKLTYGTAGFRMSAQLLPSVLYRVGLLAVLRSKFHATSSSSPTIGVMITASHNPYQDNGVKLVEPMGDMLAQDWEKWAMELANAPTPHDLVEVLEAIVKEYSIDMTAQAKVLVARDTRPSGLSLVEALKSGVAALQGDLLDEGIKTTPQCHYLVRCLNTRSEYGVPTEEGYFDKLAKAYKRIISGKRESLTPLIVDAANGVGAPAMEHLTKALGPNTFTASLINTDIQTPEKLNSDCGADYVKMYQKEPRGFSIPAGARCASLDGDADRIVFYYQDAKSVFKLLDGDKIATLAAGFIMRLVKEAGLSEKDIQVGLVQTAYANGSSTSYVKDTLKTPVVFTPTGVKHLHHAAEEFDVGVYFEANGHGTVLFSKNAISLFHSKKGSNAQQERALEILRALTDLINQTVGDALSDLLLVEAICTYDNLSFENWDKAYTDLPSKQEKVKVADRSIFVPIQADTELSHPEGIQAKINVIVSEYPQGRSFVRPSGTEDIVRVYAEASTRDATDQLAGRICGLVFDHYGGVGQRPAHFR